MTIVRAALAAELALSVLAGPVGAADQPTNQAYRIGWLGDFLPTPTAAHLVAAFMDGLREFGYLEGTNLKIEFRWTNGQADRLPELVRELVKADVQVVVTSQTPAALTLKERAKTLPVVLLGVSRPVGSRGVDGVAGTRDGGTAVRLP